MLDFFENSFIPSFIFSFKDESIIQKGVDIPTNGGYNESHVQTKLFKVMKVRHLVFFNKATMEPE
jgi:hypothetical protein